MPWPPRQQRAIAASLKRKGKSDQQVSTFFRSHGHGGDKKSKNRRLKKRY